MLKKLGNLVHLYRCVYILNKILRHRSGTCKLTAGNPLCVTDSVEMQHERLRAE